MTALEHLKQRLATGSLGGDQDEKAVDELIAENERIKLELEMRDGTLNMAVARLGGIVEGNPTGRHNFLQRIDELVAKEAALAQKTRECDALDEIHRGHVEGTLCEQIEAERDALKSQVEQLQKQVAELSKPVTASRTPNSYYLQAIHKFARQKSKQGFPIDKTDEWDNR